MLHGSIIPNLSNKTRNNVWSFSVTYLRWKWLSFSVIRLFLPYPCSLRFKDIPAIYRNPFRCCRHSFEITATKLYNDYFELNFAALSLWIVVSDWTSFVVVIFKNGKKAQKWSGESSRNYESQKKKVFDGLWVSYL